MILPIIQKNEMVYKTLLAIICCTFLTSCTTRYRWKADHNDSNRYRRENAECKLMARNAARSVQNYNSTSYTATTYDYGSIRTTNIHPNYVQEGLNDIATAIQQAATENETYELCMQSKGYRKTKITDSQQRGKGRECTSSTQCGDSLLCDDIRGICIPSIDYVHKYSSSSKKSKKHTKTNNSIACTDSVQCPDKMLCDEKENICISSIKWVEKYLKKRKK
jgi:phosphatidylethanolamine-binding protein (PEBP) family uncharacterized protein